jgi:hypothetical protein
MYRSCWLTLTVVLIAFNSFGQITFEKGYYIDSQGNKTECLIKDSDWKNSPSSFNYKLDEAGEVQKMDTKDVSEFEVADTKYVRAHVRYDQSSQELKKLTTLSNPDWVEGDLMLKVIVEGKATLYTYEDPARSLYFFSVDKSPIEQLVFKNYMPSGDISMVAANKMYLSQINGRVRCMNVPPVTDRTVPYQQRPLAKHFTNYNICSGDVVKEKPTPKKALAIRLTPGVDFTKVTARAGNSKTYNYGGATSFRLGAEFQFTLPFNNGKWGVLFEPTYESFNSNKAGSLKYQGIEFPLGIRHRFFLSEKSSIFVNGMALLEFQLSKTAGVGGIPGFAAGAGYSFGRFSLEGRYYPLRQRGDPASFAYHYTRSSLIFGFRVF